jgi:ligand-binding SRPBCC domain-containing protein
MKTARIAIVMVLFNHTFRAETKILGNTEDVFKFFSDAQNLELITPPELSFKIISPLPIKMETGALIEYKIRLFGFSFRWKAIISKWDKNRQFIDEQLKGPYSKWVHTHIFYKKEGDVIIKDIVKYRIPFAPFGEIILPLVKLQLKRIFDYRSKRIIELID